MSRLILSGGMQRSGSTLLFNILKLVLSHDKQKVLSAGWVHDIERLPAGDIYLIKLHHINWLRGLRAAQVFYTYRDLRDALVSFSRKFDQPTIELARKWIADFQWAERHADRMIRYEDLIGNLEEVVSCLMGDLHISAPVQEIIANIPDDKSGQNRDGRHSMETLFHSGHRTNTRTGEWRRELDSDLLDRLHSEFDWWFLKNGYDTY